MPYLTTAFKPANFVSQYEREKGFFGSIELVKEIIFMDQNYSRVAIRPLNDNGSNQIFGAFTNGFELYLNKAIMPSSIQAVIRDREPNISTFNISLRVGVMGGQIGRAHV